MEFSWLFILLLGLFVVLNVWTFGVYAFDKYRAHRAGKRRVSEKMLWFLALIGGSLGAFLAMNLFRHKTRKTSFRFVLFLIFFIQALLLGVLLYVVV